jgi:hypothetical protein
MPTFPCPNCGKSLSIREEFAVKTCKCPACGQKMTVSRPSPSQGKCVPPKPPVVEEIPEVLPASIQSAKQRTSKSSRITNREGNVPKWVWLIPIPVLMLFVCCGGIFFIGLTDTDGRKETQGSSVTSANLTVNDDPLENLLRLWLAWWTCESKTGFPPMNSATLNKYLKQQGNPSEILKGIRIIRWGYGSSNPEVPIACQATTKDGKYYILFGSGKIDHLDEDEMFFRGVSVGKYLEQSKKIAKDNIRKQLEDNEDRWLRAQKDYEEQERKDDAFEKQLKTPEKNPTLEQVRKGHLPFELKVLSERREERKRGLEVARQNYEQQKKRLEEELKR